MAYCKVKRLFSTPPGKPTVFENNRLQGYKIELKDELDFCNEIYLIFSMRFVQEQFRGYLPCECLIFSCVPGVTTKYLSPFFCCIGPFYIESCIFNI